MSTTLARNERRLCRLGDIPDGGSRGFPLAGRTDDVVFAVRRGEQVFVYRNVCPHAGSPLAWSKNDYLTANGERIHCYLHGAYFDVESGECTSGPCQGESLTLVPNRIDNGEVIVNVDGLVAQRPPRP